MSALTGLILAGGHSRRMGRDKGAMVLRNGLPQTVYLAELLFPYVERVFVSCREEQLREPHISAFQTVTDQFDFATPLNGILSAMQAQPNKAFLVVAVDMVGLDDQAMQALIAARNPQKPATCFESPVKGGPDPLFSIWEPSALAPALKLAREERVICPRGILKTVGADVVKNGLAPHYLANANTPKDLADLNLALEEAL